MLRARDAMDRTYSDPLDIPTLVVHGAEDIRPPWAVDSLHRALPRSQRMTIAHAGHLPWAEAADTLRTTISEFLATPDQTDGTNPVHAEPPGSAALEPEDGPLGSR